MFDLNFSQIPEWVFKSQASSSAIRCYLYLDTYMDRKLNFCFVSIGRLADDMGVSRRMISKYIKELKDVGAIAVVPRYNTGKTNEQLSSIYIKVATPSDYNPMSSVASMVDSIKSANPDWVLGSIEYGSEEQKFITPQEPGVPDPQEPGVPAPQEPQVRREQEPINNNQLTSKSSIEDEFEQWWKHVPRKEAKGDARKAFKAALKKTSLEVLTNSMQRYALTVRDSEKRFIKMPAGWLRDERWNDFGDRTEGSQTKTIQKPSMAPGELSKEEVDRILGPDNYSPVPTDEARAAGNIGAWMMQQHEERLNVRRKQAMEKLNGK